MSEVSLKYVKTTKQAIMSVPRSFQKVCAKTHKVPQNSPL